MNVVVLVWSYLKARPLNTLINILLLALGIAVITLLLLLNKQLEEKISNNARGIDLVIGAKGSPLQLILCNIFHIDYPTGNISLREAERFAKHRLVKKAIPLALGDSYNSYRIVGTNRDYPALYSAEIAQGEWFAKPLEVTLGSNVAGLSGLKMGDKFASAHGLVEGGHAHDEHQYVVVGTLKPSNSVIDNLIFTNVESVWQMHEEHEEDEEEHDDGEHEHEEVKVDSSRLSPLIPSIRAGDSTRQVTSLLVQYRSAMGAVQLPRIVNGESSLQAASPAFETARLFSILGVGVDILMAFAYVLIVISALSIFIALYNSLKERRYDLAILRSMGASRMRLFFSILLEGGILTVLGSLLGLFMAHGVVWVLAQTLPQISNAGLSGFVFYRQEWIILAASLLMGVTCALLPAVQAYRTDISKVLSGHD
jgi:putative ABC transport system permease protein